MTFAADLRHELAEDDDISAIVGDRIWPMIDKGKELPSMVYNISGGFTPAGFKSTSTPKEWSVQIDVYTKNYANIPAMHDAIESKFNRFRGNIGDSNETTVYRSYVEDSFETPNTNDDDVYRVTYTLTFQTD